VLWQSTSGLASSQIETLCSANAGEGIERLVAAVDPRCRRDAPEVGRQTPPGASGAAPGRLHADHPRD
jgi:hypothetical protein